VNISMAERAAVEAYLDSLALEVRNLAERLNEVKTALRGPASPTRQSDQQDAAPARRSQRGAP